MTSRERIELALAHQEADRVPIHDSPWGATISRWHREGLPEVWTKFTVAKVDGGYICHSDHPIPENVSFAQYQRVLELVARYGRY